MPYIKQEDRNKFESLVQEMYDKNVHFTSGGELNFLISSLCDSYWQISDQNYQAISDIMAALEGAKLEFYRRKAAPYEDRKLKENGDVYNE